jgi:hypothetical protein
MNWYRIHCRQGFTTILFTSWQNDDDAVVTLEKGSTHIITHGNDQLRKTIRDALLDCLSQMWLSFDEGWLGLWNRHLLVLLMFWVCMQRTRNHTKQYFVKQTSIITNTFGMNTSFEGSDWQCASLSVRMSMGTTPWALAPHLYPLQVSYCTRIKWQVETISNEVCLMGQVRLLVN